MNIFEHRADFFGYLDREALKESLMSIFRLANKIRLRLGKQGYLLDCYISMFFEGVSSMLSFDAADEGIRAGGDFHELLCHVMDGTEPKKAHPLYQKAKEVYEQYMNKLVFQESYTNRCLLLFLLVDELMAAATDKFISTQVSAMYCLVDIVRMQVLFDQISHLAGEAMMEELNQKLSKRFLIAPLSAVFAQGCTDEVVISLMDRDIESSRQMFQVFMDGILESDTI